MAKPAVDPFSQEADETRSQARMKAAEAKKMKPRKGEETEMGGIRWGPIAMMLLIVLSTLLPGLLNLFDSLGKLGFTAFQPDYEGRVLRFYQANNPSKVGEVPTVMRKYKGKEEALFAKLEAKYGIKP
jgi:hypothetical protein